MGLGDWIGGVGGRTLSSAASSDPVATALEAVRHAIDVSVGSTGPNHPLREAERLLEVAQTNIEANGDRALRAALRDLSEQLQPFVAGDRLISFQAVEGLERYVGRTDVLHRLSRRSSASPPSRRRPLRSSPRLLRNPTSGTVDEEPPMYPRSGKLGRIDDDLYAEVLGVFALEARDQLRLLQAALRRTESESRDYAARQEVYTRLKSLKSSASWVGAEDVRLVAHAAEDLAAVLLGGTEVRPRQASLLNRACSALESLTLGDAAERSTVHVAELVEALNVATETAQTGAPGVASTASRADLTSQSDAGTESESGAPKARESGSVDGEAVVDAPETPTEPGDAEASVGSALDVAAQEARFKDAIADRSLSSAAAATWDQEQLVKLDQLVRELDEARALVDRRRYRFDGPLQNLRSTTGHLRDLAERVRSLVDRETIDGATGDTPSEGEERHSEKETIAADRVAADHLLKLGSELEECAAELATCDLQVGFATSELETDLGQLRRSIQLLKQRVGQFRQLPLEGLARRLHGVVRGAANERGKKVELVLEGFDRSLDQGLVETIGDCLLCLIQNAVQHGIESPELRRLRGKSRIGVVTVKARSLGPKLVLEVTDDGAGLDEKAVRSKAIERGLLPVGDAAISNEQAWDMARRPGFSVSSEQAGHGLDLVADSLARVSGELQISSEAHEGTQAVLQMPTDLTLSRGLVVERAGTLVAVPSASVMRVTRVDDSIEVIRTAEEGQARFRGAIEFRGERFEVVDMAEVFGASSELVGAVDHGAVLDGRTLLLVKTKSEQRALLVDRVRDAGELAIYPAGPLLDRYPGVLGFALGEADQLLPVLDVAALSPPDVGGSEAEAEREQTQARETVLVVDDVASVRRVVGLLLERLGVRTVVVASAEEALRQVAELQSPPMMALIDVMMPEMSGHELVVQLRERGFDFPIYLFTSPAADLPQLDDLAVEGYVFKPLVRRELEALLKRHRSLSQGDGGAEGTGAEDEAVEPREVASEVRTPHGDVVASGEEQPDSEDHVPDNHSGGESE